MTQMANEIVRADVAQRVARAPAQQRVDDAVRVRGQHAGDVLTTPAAVHCKLTSRCCLSGYTECGACDGQQHTAVWRLEAPAELHFLELEPTLKGTGESLCLLGRFLFPTLSLRPREI